MRLVVDIDQLIKIFQLERLGCEQIYSPGNVFSSYCLRDAPKLFSWHWLGSLLDWQPWWRNIILETKTQSACDESDSCCQAFTRNWLGLQNKHMLHNLYVSICVRKVFFRLFVDFWLHCCSANIAASVSGTKRTSLSLSLGYCISLQSAVLQSCRAAGSACCMWAVVQGCLSYSCNTLEIYNICDTFWQSCAIKKTV